MDFSMLVETELPQAMDVIEFVATLHWKDTICGFLIEKGIGKGVSWLYNKIKPQPIEKAFYAALKQWKTHFYVKGYYKEHRLETLADFSEYVMKMKDIRGDRDMNELFRLFEEELKKDEKTYNYLIELREKAIELGIAQLIGDIAVVKKEIGEHTRMLHAIIQKLSEHNKGLRAPFSYPEAYVIQRKCSTIFNSDDYIKYFLEHKDIGSHKLVDYVLGNTDCDKNKFVLYGDAHSGKTTELNKLCYDLQENGVFVPVMFEVKHHPDLLRDLPAFNDEDDKRIVVIIDAMDERFDGEERNQLFNEIDGYARGHRYLKMVLSCRSNIKDGNNLQHFKPLCLDELGKDDVETYLKSRRSGKLLEEIERKDLLEMTRTPFNLMSMVDYYKKEERLPENVGELYDFFITRRIDLEIKKNIRWRTTKLKRSTKALSDIAVALQLMAISQLSEEDTYYLLDDDDELLNACLRTDIIKRTNDHGYSFEQNTYKEHYVAKFLLTKDIDAIQNLCCYSGTKEVKADWYNTIALLLSYLPKEAKLSKQVVNWIVSDNNKMVLYVDHKMLSDSQRTSVFIDILKECQKKGRRFGDFEDTHYRQMMAFGMPEMNYKSVDYLERELRKCRSRDNHMVNILFLLKHLHWEKLPEAKAKKLEDTMLRAFGRLIKMEDTSYPLYVAFSNSRLQRREIVDQVYSKIKTSTSPEVVNQFVEYLNDSHFAEDYIDVIISMGKHIRSYERHGAICTVTKRHLHDAYKSVTIWENIQKVLIQMTKELKEHQYSYDSEIRDYHEILTELFGKIARQLMNHPERADFVYEVLINMAEDLRDLKRAGAEPFIVFFEKSELTQYYFELSLTRMKEKLFDRQEWGEKSYEYHKQLEAYAYCTSLFLTEERIEEICAGFKNNSHEGYNLLTWVGQTATDEMKDEIETILKSRYPSHWIDPNKPSLWDVRRKKDYDELMDYTIFKEKVLNVVDEKAPKNRDDIRALRHVKVKFSDEEDDRINNYVFSLLYRYASDNDYIDLDAVREFINDRRMYNKMVVIKTLERLHNVEKNVVLTDEQRKIYTEAVIEWLLELMEPPFDQHNLHQCPPLSALLHGDVSVEKDMLLKLLPYSCNSIYVKEEPCFGSYYTLFQYIKEQFSDEKDILVRSLLTCMNRKEVLVEENQKLWGKYLISSGETTETGRIIGWLKKMEDGDPAYSIIKALTKNRDSREILLRKDVMKCLSWEKQEYVYELLAEENELDEFVKNGMERVFNRLEYKGRALHFMLAKGSLKGLKYLSNHLEMFGRNFAMHYQSLEALPLLIKLYVKTLDFQPRYDYSCLLNAMEEISLASEENWKVVKIELEKLIKKSRKLIGLNWYLDKWGTIYLERNTQTMKIEEVKRLLS
jgi:hypothetical protein